MNIIYMGTPDFAVPCLERLAAEGFAIPCVVTQTDKPRGRKQELTPSDVKVAALKLGLNVYQPATLKTQEAYDYLKQFEPDFIVVAAYGKILPKAILDLPKYACINVHGSLLPKYRGAAPIQRSVLSGDKVTGITTMLMAEGIDTGDILLKKEYEIGENETSGEVFDALSALSPDLLLETIDKFVKGEITPVKQNEDEATYAAMLSKNEAEIDCNLSSAQVHNLIRGMLPWPVAFTFFGGKKTKIYGSYLTGKKSSGKIGDFVSENKELFLVCAGGELLGISSLQLEGSKRLDAKQFLAGHRVEKA